MVARVAKGRGRKGPRTKSGGADGTRWYYGALDNVFATVMPGRLSIGCRVRLQGSLLNQYQWAHGVRGFYVPLCCPRPSRGHRTGHAICLVELADQKSWQRQLAAECAGPSAADCKNSKLRAGTSGGHVATIWWGYRFPGGLHGVRSSPSRSPGLAATGSPGFRLVESHSPDQKGPPRKSWGQPRGSKRREGSTGGHRL